MLYQLSYQANWELFKFPGGGGGILRISSDGDDRRTFLGLKFLIPGFFRVGKFGKYSFGWLDLSRDFFGYSKQDSWWCPRIAAALSFYIMFVETENVLGVSSVVKMTYNE